MNLDVLPDIFLPDEADFSEIKRLKKSLARKFSWKRRKSLESAYYVGFYFMLAGRHDVAVDIFRRLEAIPFTGDYDLWMFVEYAMAMRSRLDKESIIADVRRKISASGVTENRLLGDLLEIFSARAAQARDYRDVRHEIACLEILASESNWLAIVRDGAFCDSNLQRLFQETCDRLSFLLKIADKIPKQ